MPNSEPPESKCQPDEIHVYEKECKTPLTDIPGLGTTKPTGLERYAMAGAGRGGAALEGCADRAGDRTSTDYI
jgi:hypothetical protein